MAAMPAKTPQKTARSFTVVYNGRVNVLKTEVFVAMAFDPSQTKTFPTTNKFIAIWDTGATNSVITKKIVDECSLKPIAMTEVHTASGTKHSEVFLVNIGLPNKVAFTHVKVAEGILFGDTDILIGMDIISQGDFAVTNSDGKTTFSFRIPSTETIDFVKRMPPVHTPGRSVGRNDPCPCGSGKKYKKCHGR